MSLPSLELSKMNEVTVVRKDKDPCGLVLSGPPLSRKKTRGLEC